MEGKTLALVTLFVTMALETLMPVTLVLVTLMFVTLAPVAMALVALMFVTSDFLVSILLKW